jgi:hypothetical protein
MAVTDLRERHDETPIASRLGARGRTACGAPPGEIFLEVVQDPALLDALAPVWSDLARRSLTANPAIEPYYVLPLFRHLPGLARDVRYVLIWQPRVNDSDLLIGFFPMERKRWRWGLPVATLASWHHLYTFFGAPLVDHDYAFEAFEGFFDWARQEAPYCLFSHIQADGRFADQLQIALVANKCRSKDFGGHQRAALKPGQAASEYIAAFLPRKRRKEYRRLRTRLGEQGRLAAKFTKMPPDPGQWFDRFAATEAKGWKGRRGTALATRPEWAAFFRDAVIDAAATGHGLFWELTLDGEPVAMCFGFRSGQQAWLLKIAHDPAFGRYSPGALLLLDMIDTLAGEAEIEIMDSCAVGDHELINRLWRERIAVHDLLIDLSGSGLRFQLICGLEALRRGARGTIKKLFMKLPHGSRT